MKHASAHDLRRSFGDRWAKRVIPVVLMQFMRHSDIKTTLRFYVAHDADATADAVWAAAEATERALGGGGLPEGNTSGNTPVKTA